MPLSAFATASWVGNLRREGVREYGCDVRLDSIVSKIVTYSEGTDRVPRTDGGDTRGFRPSFESRF